MVYEVFAEMSMAEAATNAANKFFLSVICLHSSQNPVKPEVEPSNGEFRSGRELRRLR